MNETEFKTLLNEEKFNALMAMLISKGINYKIIRQTNNYYDDRDHSLYKTHKTLKVRSINQVKQIISKGVSTFGDDSEQTRTDNILLSYQGELPEKIKINNNWYTLQGELTTIRTSFMYLGFVISLDKSEFLDETDFELEVELIDKQYKIHEISKLFRVNWDEFTKRHPTNRLTKFNRFMITYEKKREG